MYNFDQAKSEAFNKLLTHENVSVVDKNHLEEKYNPFQEVWKIKKEVSNAEGIGKELTFYLCLRKSFPLSMPVLYLSKDSYDLVKYIPHLDSNYKLCTFDSEITRTDPDNPYGIILECLKRGREIIEAGIRKDNIKDFKEEFLAYWECKYEENFDVNRQVLSLIERDPNEVEVILLQLEKKLNGYTHILYQETEENTRVLNFLKESGYKYKIVELLYTDQPLVYNIPPFDISNRSGIKMIENTSQAKHKEFKKKINKGNQLFVLFKKTIGQKEHYLGWFHSKPFLQQDGFRNGKLTSYTALTLTSQSLQKVERVSPDIYTSERMNARTSGTFNDYKLKLLIAGLGSIGSNLLYFLNSLSYPEFRLIDYDTISVENMGRHLLGIHYVNTNKTIAIKKHLQHINPKQNILTEELSLIEVFEKDVEFINNSDYLFIVTGKLNTENWVAEKIKMGDIKKPVFIIWVEPYLAGGHCIYIHPNNYKYNEFYHTTNGITFFNGNIIHDNEYLIKKEIITLKEAGCQTSFTPYSGSNVVLFLSTIYPYILKIIRRKTENSFCISWIGDKNSLEDLGIELSEFGKMYNSFEIIEYGI